MKSKRPLILASSSPRRQFLMKEAGFKFRVEKPDVDESFPPEMPVDQVARYLAEKKAEIFRLNIRDEIILTADTVVILGDQIMNKPQDRTEAIAMLTALAGATHLVMTGVCIMSKEKEESFDVTTKVIFNDLTKDQIEFYVDQYKPFDKAGAYGAQDCLSPKLNPCSQEEINFLETIGRSDLVMESFTKRESGSGMDAIKRIDGSYFNVMGLPIHTVYEHLIHWL